MIFKARKVNFQLAFRTPKSCWSPLENAERDRLHTRLREPEKLPPPKLLQGVKEPGPDERRSAMTEKELMRTGRCNALARKSGKPCRAPAVRGAIFCSLHSEPSRAAELGRRGGQKSRIPMANPSGESATPPRNAVEACRALEEIIASVRNGEMGAGQGKALTYMIGMLLKAYPIADMEIRLRALEKAQSEFSVLQSAPRETVIVREPSPKSSIKQSKRI